MKYTIHIIILLLLSLANAGAQREGVFKSPSTDGITEDLDILTGRIFTIGSGGTFHYHADAAFTGSASDFRADIGLGTAATVNLGTGVEDWLSTPNSANLALAVTDKTGTNALVFSDSPVLTTPDLGTPSAVDLTNATNIPIGEVDGLGANVKEWLITPSSANLRLAMTDETGSNALYFVGGALGTPASATLTNATGLPTGGLVDDAVTNAKLANMAQATIKGRAAGAGTGDATDLSADQAMAVLDGATDAVARQSDIETSEVLLATQTASNSATIQFTSGFTSTYRRYRIVIDGVQPATDAVAFCLRISDDGGSTWKSTGNYSTSITMKPLGFGETQNDTTGQTQMWLTADQTFYYMSNASGEHGFFTIEISDPSTSRAALVKSWGSYMANDAGTTPFVFNETLGLWTAAQLAINGVQFFFSSGNIATGRFRLYGIP